MVLNERQTKILDYINTHTTAKVKTLAQLFYVSEMTVRRDLRELEKEGYLHRYNGGATCCTKDEMLPFNARKLLHAEYKARIAEVVKPFIENDISVYIDSSSTCHYILPLLKEYRGIHIFTNSISASFTAAEYHINCTLSGGELCERDLCTVGTETIEFLQKINVDVAFFSLQAISSDGKITDNDEPQTAVRRAVLKNCAKSVLLMDKSKQNKTKVYTFADVSDISNVIIL